MHISRELEQPNLEQVAIWDVHIMMWHSYPLYHNASPLWCNLIPYQNASSNPVYAVSNLSNLHCVCKAANDNSNPLILATHIEDWDGVPVSGFGWTQAQPQQLVIVWEINHRLEDLCLTFK